MYRNTETETARDITRDSIEILTPTTNDPSRVRASDGDRLESVPAPDSDRNKPDPYDPFSPENLRIDQSELDQPAVKAELTSIPIKKPDSQDFFRVHPDPAYRLSPLAFIELKKNSEYYIVAPEIRKYLKPREYWLGTLFLCVNRYEKLFFWLIKTQSPLGQVSDWYLSALGCAERAMEHWVQLIADKDAGVYTTARAEDDLEEPVFPNQSFAELFKLGCKRRLVDSTDHAVFKHLRGRN